MPLKFVNVSQAKKDTNLSYIGGVNTSAKIVKNMVVGNTLTYIIYMAPANISGYNVCAFSTAECRLGCLNTSGRAAIDILSGTNKIMKARITKTKLLFEEPDFFMDWVIQEITTYKKQAAVKGYNFNIRLNGTSDVNWTEITRNGKTIFELFPDVQFYDYTKDPGRFFNLPENYNLTFSYTGRNIKACEKLLNLGFNVAVVFNVKNESDFPKTFMGYPVINGDLSDLRTNDDKGVIVGLKWKKIADKANNETVKNSIFVVQKDNQNCIWE